MIQKHGAEMKGGRREGLGDQENASVLADHLGKGKPLPDAIRVCMSETACIR